ncbi:MAG: diguanylate cyclase [Acidimicrobiia bacterium]|nr:diguanylate cyclase [Acidimicrobiia bacterium]
MRSTARVLVLVFSMLAASLTTVTPSVAQPATEPVTCTGEEATIVGTDGDDTLLGTSKRDVIVALGGDDDIHGGNGNDLICAGAGADSVNGGNGKDTIRGEAGQVTVAYDISLTGPTVADSVASPVYEFLLADGSNGFESAILTLPYRPDLLNGSDPSTLEIYTYDEQYGLWVPVDGPQTVDVDSNSVSATVDHFQAHVLEARAADGLRMLSIRVRTVGRDGSQRRVLGSISDITATEQLRHQATHDELTGLSNRSMITAQLEQAMALDPQGALALFIDLDGFKAVNDTYGHDAGDAVLVEIAKRLTSALRPGDHVGRYGGDEFVVVCRGIDDHGADVLVERLRSSTFAQSISFDGGTWLPRASIGHARPDGGADVAAVLRDADHAMFEVKRSQQDATTTDTSEPSSALTSGHIV